MSCVNFSWSISFGPGTPISLMLMLMNPTSSISGVTYGPGPENRTQARKVCGFAKMPCRNCGGRSSWTMNSPRTMPCVLVFPPRSNPPGFHRPRICCSKLETIEASKASSSAIGRSSAMRNPSLGRCMLMSAVVNRVSPSPNSASNAGRTNGSNRRSMRTISDRKSLSRSRKTEPVLARGAGRLVVEFTAAECLEELDQRRLVVVGQIGPEQMAAVHHQVGTLAQLEHRLHQVGERCPGLVAGRVSAEAVQPFEDLDDQSADLRGVPRLLQRIGILGQQLQVREQTDRRPRRNRTETDAVLREQGREQRPLFAQRFLEEVRQVPGGDLQVHRFVFVAGRQPIADAVDDTGNLRAQQRIL